MADLSKNLPKNVGNDLTKAFRDAISLTGNLDATSATRIKSASEKLNSSLGRPYDRIKNTLVSSVPDEQQLDDLIKSRVPSNYVDKAYKRFFWREVYQVVPFLREKKKTEDQINTISLLALTTFGIIFESLFVHSNALISQLQLPDTDDTESDSFDPELNSTTKQLERAVKPSQGKNQHQKTTEENVQRKLKNVTPSSAVADPEAFRDFLGSNARKIDACRVSVTKHSDSLTEVLKWSTEGTFKVIKESALRAQQLAQVLSSASTSARTELQPGTYIACQGLLKAIIEVNNIVIQSVALNRSQRSLLNTKLKEMKNREPSRAPSEEDEEDSW